MFTRIYYKALAAMQLTTGAPNYSTSFTNYLGNTITTTTGISNYFYYFANGRKNLCKSAKNASSLISSNYSCVAFGDGDTPPTLDDYQLSGNHFTTYEATISSQLDTDSFNTVDIYTITNTGTSAFTIKEIGVFTSAFTTATQFALVFREVLDSPVTIEPGGVGQVTLTTGVAIPT